MPEAWKGLDLGGEGLQSLNLRLSREMRRRPLAYALALGFPLGLHRLYLKSPAGAALYWVLSTAAVAAWLWLGGAWAAGAALAELALLAFDLVWIDRRVVAYNKALRMRRYLRAGARPPAGYRGRYTEQDELADYLREKAGERAGHQPVDFKALEGAPRDARRPPSFAEQEAMLRELARAKKGKGEG